MEKINKYDIWLSSINGVGYCTYAKIINYFGMSENVWNADREELEKLEIKKEIIDEILDQEKEKKLEDLLEDIYKQEIEIIDISDARYPAKLKQIERPPINLYAKGNLSLLNKFSLAIVGSRNCSVYGEKVAENLAHVLSEKNITIISGLAVGIDTFAHKGALKNEGRTIAVLGSGFRKIYPKENKKLFSEIIANGGLVLTEYYPDFAPLLGNFPARNRIVSALSEGVIVVEAKEKSGALITAKIAKEQGKTVFAIPGNITSMYSKGSNNLIKSGAKIVTDLDDILEEFDDFKTQKKAKKKKIIPSENLDKIPEQYKNVYKLISEGNETTEQIKNKLNDKVSNINSILTMLEIEGYIESIPGGKFIIK